MRRRSLSVLILAATIVALGAWTPADAGPGNNNIASNRFTVEKVVEGPVPPGAVFEVEVDCVPFQNGIGNGSPNSEGAPMPVTFQFDENGDPIGDNAVMVGFGYDCTATETETNGAQVSYACDTIEPNVIIVAASEGNGPVVECIDDQTVRFSYPFYVCTDVFTEACVEAAEPMIPEIYAEGIITVTNTFEVDVIDDDDERVPDAAADADVVAATPTFTG